MSKYLQLSHPLSLGDPRPPAIPAPELTDLYTVAADGANVQILRLASHTGTHLDSPRHVIDDGVRITEYVPEELIFTRIEVVDLSLADAENVQPGHLEPHSSRLQRADLALFRFGYGDVRRQEPERFSTRCPGFCVESARWLRATCPQLRAMGLDVPSVSTIAHLEETMAAHNELLSGAGRRFLIIEDMKLDEDLRDVTEVRVSPWLVLGMDSGPCTVLGIRRQA